MNDEINIKILGQILDYVDTKEHLLDLFNYITNLQQENERLEGDNDFLEDTCNDLSACIKEQQRDIDDYNSRCEKAIEYIKEHIRIDDEYPDYMEMLVEERDDLLNILQNGSEENE